jgi:hypothetical protein
VIRRAMLALAIAVLLTPAAASADGPLSLVTSVDLPSNAHDVALAGDFAYVATDTGLTVLDVGDRGTPEAPIRRGAVAAGKCQNVEVSAERNLAFLACTTALKVVDIANPDAPRAVATRTLPYVWDVAVQGTVVYVASFAGELYVVDVSAPTAPRVVKTIGLVGWGNSGPDAQNLARLNAHVTSGSAKASGVSVAGNRLFTVDWGYGRLYAYDISVPADPIFAGTHYVPYVLKAVADPGRNMVYMLSAYSSTSGIYTLPVEWLDPNVSTTHATCSNVPEPTSPGEPRPCRYIRNTRNVGIDQGGLALTPDGRHLFYGGGRHMGEFSIVDPDTDTPASLRHLATVPIGLHRVGTANIMNGESAGELIYFAAGALGVQVYRWPGL